jgi:cobalt-precorrin 5A hydrolase
MRSGERNGRIAVWAITPNGAALASTIAGCMPRADLFVSTPLSAEVSGAATFDRLADAVAANFSAYRGHVFIMSTGIVVRMIAPHLRHKTSDPAVVVVDEGGRHAISLVSGHIGGANRLAAAVAEAVGAEPVITTATDIQGVPAIDLIAGRRHLAIENPGAIKHVNMALLTGSRIVVHDPYGWLESALPTKHVTRVAVNPEGLDPGDAAISVDDTRRDLSPRWLRLRPPALIAGMGCNRNTPGSEIKQLLSEVLEHHRLAAGSLAGLATIDIKRDEPGLIALAEELALPLTFFTKEQLNRVRGVASPSARVKKHVGVESVCEAAAILGSDNGRLIVPKQRTKNVTVAIARRASLSSVSDRAASTTSPNGRWTCSPPWRPWPGTPPTST